MRSEFIEDDAVNRQLIMEFGIDKQHIFMEKKISKGIKHQEYNKMLKSLRPGDVVFIKNLDSLGDSYEEVIKQWKVITQKKQTDIVVLDVPILDTRKGKEIIGSFLSEVVIAVLGAVSEIEKKKHEALILKNAKAIDEAKKKGVRFGRPANPVPDNCGETVTLWKNGEMTIKDATKALNMPASTFYDKSKKWIIAQDDKLNKVKS